MPGHSAQELLTFSPTITEAALKHATPYPQPFVINTMIQLSNYLIGIVEFTGKLFGDTKQHDAYSASLRTLHDRLHIGRLALSPIAKEDETVLQKTIGQSVGVRIEERALHDFEDLFYALVTRMQEMRQTLNVYLSFEHIGVQNVLFDGGPTIADFHRMLAEYWTVLNDAAFVRALDDAVKAWRVEYTSEQIKAMVEANTIGIEDAEPCLRGLLEGMETGRGIDMKILNWSPAMVAAYLDDRYRTVLGLEKKFEERKAREVKRRAKTKSKASIDDSKSQRVSKRLSGDALSSGKHGKGNRKTLAVRPSPAKSVRFVLKPECEMRVDAQEVDNKARIEGDHGSNVLQTTYFDHEDPEDQDTRKQRALQADLHRSIKQHLRTDSDRSLCRNADLDSTRYRPQYSGRIDQVGSGEYAMHEVAERESDEMDF